MSQKEINLFENELHQALCSFIDSMLEIKDIKIGISLETMKLHTNLIQEDFLEEYEEYNKKDHAGLMKSESANLGLLFLLDLLQFFYQFLSTSIQKPLEKDAYLVQDISQYAKLHNTVPSYLNHKFEYTISDSVNLVKSILKAIKAICPNPAHMLELWHLRRHIEVLTNITTEDEVREDQTYERTDKFNSVGLLMYFYWCLKPRVNCSVEEGYRHSRFEELEGFESPLPETITREFEFEILCPLIANALKDKLSYPVLYDVALEILSYYCRVLDPKKLGFPLGKITAAGNGSTNYKWLLQAIFEFVGSGNESEEKKKVAYEVYKKLLFLYDLNVMEDIAFDMIVEAKNDKEISLLVDHYRDILMQLESKLEPNKRIIHEFYDHLKVLLEHNFQTKSEYIFDITERMISTFNLWRFLYIREQQKDEICEDAKKLHEKVTKNICDDVSKLIDSVQPGLEEERDTALSNPNLIPENKERMEHHWNSSFLKLDIIRELINRIRSL